MMLFLLTVVFWRPPTWGGKGHRLESKWNVDIIEFVSKLIWHGGGRPSRLPPLSQLVSLVASTIDLSILCLFGSLSVVPLQLVDNLKKICLHAVHSTASIGSPCLLRQTSIGLGSAVNFILVHTSWVWSLKVRCSIRIPTIHIYLPHAVARHSGFCSVDAS